MDLAASILIVVIKLVSEFCASLLDCLVLFFLHTVKKIPEPLFGDWGGRTGQRYWLLLCHICDIFDVQTS